MSTQHFAYITLVVRDYDEAIDFYTRVLGFSLVEDKVMSPTKRWVVVLPPGNSGCGLLLAKAANEEQSSRVGNQTGGRVFLFLHTKNFQADLENLQKHHVKIVRGPVEEPYGKVLVFEDLYGNLIDLIGPEEKTH
jgi:catechol 2,3-dioxygenase-like lactoylglutathione lyase family enzyme